MYAPTFQTDSDLAGVQCIVALVIFGIVWGVLAAVNARTQNAESYSRKVSTTLPREHIVNLVEKSFPRSLIAKKFNWQFSAGETQLVADGYYLSNGQGCLVVLLTGLLPGYVAIWLAMKQTERVTVDLAEFEGTGQLTLRAQGLRARSIVDKLVDKLTTPA